MAACAVILALSVVVQDRRLCTVLALCSYWHFFNLEVSANNQILKEVMKSVLQVLDLSRMNL